MILSAKVVKIALNTKKNLKKLQKIILKSSRGIRASEHLLILHFCIFFLFYNFHCYAMHDVTPSAVAMADRIEMAV